MTLQEEISTARQQMFVGKTLDVLVEKIDRGRCFAEGRSFREAPDVDGVVEIENIRADLKTGEVIKVRMTDATVHDMIGEEVRDD